MFWFGVPRIFLLAPVLIGCCSLLPESSEQDLRYEKLATSYISKGVMYAALRLDHGQELEARQSCRYTVLGSA
jgi:hypothetical protein